MRILKYELLNVFDMMQIVLMPTGAKILHVGLQDDEMCIWALCEYPFVDTTNRTFMIHGTGYKIDVTEKLYLGTAVDPSHLVYHVFELL